MMAHKLQLVSMLYHNAVSAILDVHGLVQNLLLWFKKSHVTTRAMFSFARCNFQSN